MAASSGGSHSFSLIFLQGLALRGGCANYGRSVYPTWYVWQNTASRMMLRDEIGVALKQAMRDRAAGRLSTLRLIMAAIKDRDIAARAGGEDNAGVDEAEILSILAKMVKQRHESAKTYEEGGRLDLAERETFEIGVIEEFLPKQLTDIEVAEAVRSAVAETGATSIRDMGKVMGTLKSKFTGQMDFGKIGPMVKDQLNQS